MNIQSVPNGTITFPMLGEWFSISGSAEIPIFGNYSIHWYGIIIAIGFLLAYLYVSKHLKQYGLTENNFLDALLWAVPSGIVGARIYYVIFDFDLYRNNLLDIFKIWEGGLAIYGGVIGACIAIIIFARVKKIHVGAILDLAGFGLLIGQTIGRWGNFINREAFGGETDIFCRMGLTDVEWAVLPAGTTIYVHPTFLYESIWNLLGFLLIHFFAKSGKRRYDGQIFAMYVAWYGFGRMFIEGLRTDSLYTNGGIRISQLLAAVTVVAALIFLAVNHFRPHSPDKLYVNIANSEAGTSAQDASDDKSEE